jgi:hypothetical protein
MPTGPNPALGQPITDPTAFDQPPDLMQQVMGGQPPPPDATTDTAGGAPPAPEDPFGGIDPAILEQLKAAASADLQPMQKIGLAFLAAHSPQAAIELLGQHEGGRRQAQNLLAQVGMQMGARKRAEEKEEDLLARTEEQQWETAVRQIMVEAARNGVAVSGEEMTALKGSDKTAREAALTAVQGRLANSAALAPRREAITREYSKRGLGLKDMDLQTPEGVAGAEGRLEAFASDDQLVQQIRDPNTRLMATQDGQDLATPLWEQIQDPNTKSRMATEVAGYAAAARVRQNQITQMLEEQRKDQDLQGRMTTLREDAAKLALDGRNLEAIGKIEQARSLASTMLSRADATQIKSTAAAQVGMMQDSANLLASAATQRSQVEGALQDVEALYDIIKSKPGGTPTIQEDPTVAATKAWTEVLTAEKAKPSGLGPDDDSIFFAMGQEETSPQTRRLIGEAWLRFQSRLRRPTTPMDETLFRQMYVDRITGAFARRSSWVEQLPLVGSTPSPQKLQSAPLPQQPTQPQPAAPSAPAGAAQ